MNELFLHSTSYQDINGKRASFINKLWVLLTRMNLEILSHAPPLFLGGGAASSPTSSPFNDFSLQTRIMLLLELESCVRGK